MIGRFCRPTQPAISCTNADLTNATKQMWERACSRMRCVSQQILRLNHRLREQARSHIFDRVYSFTDERPGFFVCNKCENTACKSSDALSSSRLSLLSM